MVVVIVQCLARVYPEDTLMVIRSLSLFLLLLY